jgi:photoactive yellow protein
VPSGSEEREELLQTIRTELGVTSPEEVGELSELVRSMTAQLNHLSEQQAKMADLGLSFESAMTMIESMEDQLVDLYEERDQIEETAVRDRLESLQSILGVSSPQEARELESLVRSMEEQLRALIDEKREMLRRTGVDTVDNVSAMIASMEEQLVDLYETTEEYTDAKQRLDAINDVLGISSRAEAEELAGIARNMEEQLDDLYDDKQKLEAVGLDSVEDAINMITSMEDQLVELYEDKESVQDVGSVSMGPEQDTFQQLEYLYAEQEKLKRELGVADADEIIEMVEGLSTQLDELYAERDANVTDDVDALLPGDYDTESLSTAGDGKPASASGSSAGVATAEDRPPNHDLMIASMRQQLEALYEEKDVLLEHGMGDAREAISHIEELRTQIRSLNQTKKDYEQRFERMKSELGTADVAEVIRTVRSLRSQAKQPPKDAAASSSESDTQTSQASPPQPSSSSGDAGGDSSGSGDTGLVIDAAPKFVDDATLAELESLNTDELDALDFGAIRLSDSGEIRYVNEEGLKLPGLKSTDDRTTIHDKNFFLEVAPSTNNNLFFGRFKQGIQQGAMDARFPYTFISPGKGPTVLIVHLHRKRDRGVNWLLFQPM